jgi:hypothetical protein
MIALFFLPAAIVGMMEGSGEQHKVAQVKFPYEVAWDNSENGYIWKSIVVDEQYLNDESMAALGKQLHVELGNNTFAKVAIFKTEQSAILFAEAQKDPYSKKSDDAYDRDFVALYSLNSNTDYEQFVYHLKVLNREQKEIVF